MIAGLADLWRRTGVRLAMIQAGLVLLAFVLAGVMTEAGLRPLSEQRLKLEISGEAASLSDEYVRRGHEGLVHTVTKRTQFWRGFDYGLFDSAGRRLAGGLTCCAGTAGWLRIPEAQGAGHLGLASQTPDGGWVVIGKDLTDLDRQLALVRQLSLAGGAVGALACLLASWLFTRSTWRRIDDISAVAEQVATGRLAVRAPVRARPHPDDVDQLAVNFNLMLDRLQMLLAQVQQVTADVAHDLRTPLTRVRQKMEALDALPSLPSDASALIQVIDDDLQEILHSFDALLQLAEIERLDQVGNGPVIDLSEPVRRVIEAYLPDIEGQGRKLTYRLEPAFLKGDPALLSQLLANLIENVLAHTPRGSDLAIAVLGAASGPVLRVADRGPGVPPEFRHSVLQPFKRLEASRNTLGAGLGLSIAAAIATCHGAELALEDNHPGLVVEVRFRAAPQAAAPCHESVGFPD